MSRPSKAVIAEVVEIYAKLDRIRNADRMVKYFPDEDTPGYPARSKYPKHIEFFERGAEPGVMARMLMAANGVGKTLAGCFELLCHAIGWYPTWWTGKRFDRPVDIWACGKSSQAVRDTIQMTLLGKPHEEGTGLLPLEWLDVGSITRSGVPGAIDTFRIKRAAGGYSHVGFKSYEQGVQHFYGPNKDFILLDEPPPVDIYSECVARTRARPDAGVAVTMSPKEGNTETVRLFLQDPHESRVVITCGWADVPHLTEEWKSQMRASTPDYLIDATEFGLPGRGSGAVYPVKEEAITVDPFPIPKHWRWLMGMDTGYHNTAVVWLAYDPDADVIYLVSCYKDGGPGTDISVHAARIMARNRAYKFIDMPGVADAAAISLVDGAKILDEYRKLGLNLKLPNKAVNAGISTVLSRMNTGRFKVFRTCFEWFEEFRAYSYREVRDGKEPAIVKLNDHLMDCARYAVVEIDESATIETKPYQFKELKW